MAGTVRTIRNIGTDNQGVDVGFLEVTTGVFASLSTLVDATGAPLGTSANPLAVQGGTAAGGTSGPVDVTDRAARLVGHVSVDGTPLIDLVDGAGRLLGHVTIDNWPASQLVSGPLTDTQLRATPVPVSGSFWQATQPVSGPLTDAQLRAAAFPVTANQGTPAAAAWPVKDGTADLFSVSATGAAGATVTATLPAAGAGLFHYLEFIEISAYSTAARTGVATPIVVTSTNLPGNPAWTFATAAAIGSTDRYQIQPTHPLRSAAANVATTIVCPAVTSVIWRVNVHYWTGT